MARGGREGPGLLGGLVTNVAGAVTPSVMDSLDVNAVLADVDLDAVLGRVDLDAVIDRVDLDRHLDRVDVNRLLDRVDANALVERVDVNALMARVDVNALVERVDVNALTERIDVDDLVARTSVADIVTAGTTGVAANWLNYVRRLVAGVDEILVRFVGRLTRQPQPDPPGPPGLAGGAAAAGVLTGTYAGPLTRLIAYALDSVTAFALYSLGALAASYVLDLLGVGDGSVPQVVPFALLVLWLWTYYAGSWAVTGRTVGMAVAGIHVVAGDGSVVRAGSAALRAAALPLSFLAFGLGFVGLLVGARRRGLHDVVAGTVVVYDWGDRPAALPAPLVAFLERRDVDVTTARPPSLHG